MRQNADYNTCSRWCWHRCYRTDCAYSRCSCRCRRLGGKRRRRTLYKRHAQTHTHICKFIQTFCQTKCQAKYQ